VLAESINTARITFETLHNVVRGMAELRGRKVAVLVSDGFTSGLGLDARAGLDIRRITDAGTRAGVIVYALDSRGLQANTPGFSASNRGPVMTVGGGSTIGARERMARASEIATQDAMNALAADTGGFLVANTNNFSDALRRIMKDTESYYLLAYEPTGGKRDGGFRKIEVRLPGLKDARVRHRKGYFAPDDRPGAPSASGAAAGGPVPLPEDRIRAEMKTALNSATPLAGLPVRVSADFVSVDAAASQVVVSAYVDLRDVPFLRTGDRRLATVDVAGTVFDESGQVVGDLPVERAALDLTDEDYERAVERGLPYRRAATLKPGRYRVTVAVREGGGKVGNATQWTEIPDLGQGKPALSSLFLMKEDGNSPLRPVQAHPVFQNTESLYVEFFSYNLRPDATSLVTRTEIGRGGAVLAASAPELMSASGRSGPGRAHTRKINLRPFAPGDYEVRIVVTDLQTNATLFQRAGFTIQ
jgi:hypothetical protein